MTKEALERAYIAGFNDAMASFGKVRSVDLNAHCMLGFDGWYQRELDAMSTPIPPGFKVGDVAGIEGLFDDARADAIEEQEAANFAAFDPDAFVPHRDPNKGGGE